ncbi:B-box zinc finger protein [Candidatus Nanosalina sp. VS9-1]
METESICENCGESPAVTTCEVCGSKICRQCKREYGCEACNGGERTFS